MGMSNMGLNKEPVLREKILFVAALLCIFVLFYNFVIGTTSQKIIGLRKDLKGIQSEAGSIKQLIRVTESQLSKQTNSKPKKIEVNSRIQKIIDRRVVDQTEEINDTVHLLNSRDIARRVQIKEVSPGEYIDAGKFTIVPITVVLEGRYSGVSGYMSSLENIARPTIIRAVSLETLPETPGVLKASLLVYLYMVKT